MRMDMHRLWALALILVFGGGAWANVPTALDGRIISREEYDRELSGWIPSPSDRAFVKSLMQKVTAPGKMASWVAPPERGINNLPVDYEYVHLN